MTNGGFYFFCCALIILVGALVTILGRNPIRGALGLLSTIVGISGLYLQLSAQFLAAIQIIVCVGATTALLVFSVLILGADAVDVRGSGKAQVARTIGGAGMLVAMGAALYLAMPEILEQPTTFPRVTAGLGSVSAMGQHLFSIALAPFEITTALLLIAIVGGVALTRGSPSSRARRLTPKPREQMFGGPVHPRDAGHPIVKGAKS